METPIFAKSNIFARWCALLLAIATMLTTPGIVLAQTESLLHSFTGGRDGNSPQSNLIIDAEGNLYGTATLGGPPNAQYCGGQGCGVIFELSPNGLGGWKYKVLHTFTGGTDGGQPRGGLTLDADGSLYGTASIGGLSMNSDCYYQGCGVVFKLTPDSGGGWKYGMIHSFNSTDGSSPVSVVFDRSGNMYGITVFGGAHGGGTAFELSPTKLGGWIEKVLHNFTYGADGGSPTSLLIDNSTGILYGTALQGGIDQCEFPGCGLVFKLFRTSTGAWREGVPYRFKGRGDGANPVGLTMDGAGNLYGATFLQHYGGGTVFKMSPSGGSWKTTIVHRFVGGGDGRNANAAPTLDRAGNLYGTTEFGGTADAGVLYKFSFSGGLWTETILHTFTNGKDGGHPASGVVLDNQGNIYGQTWQGGIPGDCSDVQGIQGCGVVYRVAP